VQIPAIPRLAGQVFDQRERDPIARSLQAPFYLHQVADLDAENPRNRKPNTILLAIRRPAPATKADLCANINVVDVDPVFGTSLYD